jgi:hypothetical protein
MTSFTPTPADIPLPGSPRSHADEGEVLDFPKSHVDEGVVLPGSSASHEGKDEVPTGSSASHEGKDEVPAETSDPNGNKAGLDDAMVIDDDNAPVDVNLDIAEYCPWMDEKLTLEARVTAYEQWRQLNKEAYAAYHAEGNIRAACWKCKKMHPQPHIEPDRYRETNAAGAELMRQWRKEQKRKDASGLASDKKPEDKETEKPESSKDARRDQKSKPKGKTPTCPRCGRSHWPNSNGPGCHAPFCQGCQYNHPTRESCLAAQNRMRAAGLVIAAPMPAQFTAAQLSAASHIGSLIAGGAFTQVPGALAGHVFTQALQPSLPVTLGGPSTPSAGGPPTPGAGGPSTTLPHRSRKRKQTTPETPDTDSEEERRRRKKKKEEERKKKKESRADGA